MTTEEAIKTLEGENELILFDPMTGDKIEYPFLNPLNQAAYDAHIVAIAALRAQQERENPEPLTLDGLREMGGEPVFIQFRKAHLPGKWKVVQYVTDREVGFTDNTSLYLPKSSPAVPCYGKAWLAYRHKPKEG